MITAGVMGLVNRFRYILVTQGLLRCLDSIEVEAVIAHEIGHVKKKHLLFYLFFLLGLMPVIYLSDSLFELISYRILLFSFPIGTETTSSPSTLFSALFTIARLAFVILPFIIYFRFIFGYFMRNFERQADFYVFELFDTAQPLISTFQKIVIASGQSPDKPNWHHFSITERVEYLKACEIDRSWIDKHELKLKRSITAFLACFLIASGLLFIDFKYGLGKQLISNFIESHLEQQLIENPDNIKPLYILANAYHDSHKYQKAIESYNQFLDEKPEHADALNGLAWLYATCEDASFRNPEEAIRLANKAVQIKRVAPILDTLAESYFVSGNIEKAIEIEKEALRRADYDKHIYEDRLSKYEKAISNN